ncbi:MAG TPA: DUF6325 family protein [Miltoncostaeaceae bacterium]|nr:DUF6325 family protein [Miltoncostaeaceae bacterium]
MSDELELGPIDLVVIGYPAGAPMTGEAAPIIVDLVERGIIRVLDATIVTKEDDGSYSGMSVKDLDQGSIGGYSLFAGATSGLIGNDDLALVAEEMEPGATAVAILYENRWAAPFSTAVRRNGGRLLMSERIGPQAVIEALDALDALDG